MGQPERPILFSGPMVQAILAGTKRQTRRVIRAPAGWQFAEATHGRRGVTASFTRAADGGHRVLTPPYGEPGARLWVREAHAVLHDGGIVYRADLPADREAEQRAVAAVARRAGGSALVRWRPSIHMLRSAARIDLEVTAVRVQQLQDIDTADALSEGVAGPCVRDNFQRLWDDINGARPGCAWDANPWVWAVSFRRVRP